MSKRGYIRKDEELAAALLQIPFEWEDGTVAPIMDHETAKQLTAQDVISLFHRDHHPIRHEDGGPSVHWNLTWRPVSNHRKKTAKIDIPQIAKAKKLAPKTEEFRRKMLAKAGQANGNHDDAPSGSRKPKRSWGSRPMPGSKSSGWKRPMNGNAVRRTP